jgi:nucleoid-associated protein YgaU
MTRLTLVSALAILVLAVAIGLIWVMDEQDRDDLAQSTSAPEPAAEAPAALANPGESDATTGVPEAAGVATDQSSSPAPSFDIVRVNPSGDAVIAGRAGPGDMVEVLDQGRSIGSVEADDNGEWVFLPRGALSPGEHSLTLESKDRRSGVKGKSETVVVVVVPEIAKDIAGKPAEAPAGALAIEVPIKGGGAVRILNLPGETAKGTPAGSISIGAVDYGDQGATTFSGRAPVDARLIGYLNNQPVADIRADASGHWSIDQASPVGVGPHRFRVDQVDAGGRVLARAEIMFEMVLPGATASLPDVAGQDVVVVQPGQNLWLLARTSYGEGTRYTIIFEANRDQISDPDLIFPGQVLQLPPG